MYLLRFSAVRDGRWNLVRRRVLMLATTLPAEAGDGTPEFVLDVAQHMDADVTIVAPRVRGCSLRQEMRGVEIRRFRYGPRFAEGLADEAILPALRRNPFLALQAPGLIIGLALAARRAYRDLHPDVVHAHWIIPSGLIGAVLTRHNPQSLLVTAHGADAYALNDPLSRRLKRFVLRRSGRVHAVSSDIAERLAAIEPSHEAEVQPIGVDVGLVAEATRDRFPNGRVLFVGRLAEKKGVDDLLRAVAKLDGTADQIQGLDVVGDGPMRSELEGLARSLGVDELVRFHGAKRRAEVLEFYRHAEVVVVPSKTASDGDRDGTPVVVMEAIAAGVPIVATAVGGIAELLRDQRTAWVVGEADVAALAASLSAAVRDRQTAQRFASEARATIADRIDVGKVAERLLDEAA